MTGRLVLAQSESTSIANVETPDAALKGGAASGRQSKIGNDKPVTNRNDQFDRLEEKLLRAIELFKRTQAERRALEQEVEKLKGETKERAQALSAMERELIALRREREDVRSRIEKLLERIDALTSAEGGL
jgi:chromosome segregation ATPase